MPEYLAPGVYIEEISGGAKPIEAVGTSTACFIGFTEKAEQAKVIEGEKELQSVVGKPIFITSWEEYVNTFGAFVPGYFTPLSVYGFFQNGGRRCYIVSLRAIPKASVTLLSANNGESETGKYLKVSSKTPGANGEQLRIAISHKKNDPQPTEPRKIKLTITEEGATALPTGQSVSETHKITFSTATNPNEVTVSLTQDPNSRLVEISVLPDKIARTLAELFPNLNPITESKLDWEGVKFNGNTAAITVKAKAGSTGGSLNITTQKESDTKYTVTIVATAKLDQQASETLEFTLERVKYESGEVVSLLNLGKKASDLVEFSEENLDNLPDWNQVYRLWPTKEATYTLTKAGESTFVQCVKEEEKFLFLKPKKQGDAFKKLTVKIETDPPQKESERFEKPRFKLLVERNVNNAWKPLEERSISLRREIKKKIFDKAKGEERRKVLNVEYPDGLPPKYVDLLPIEADQDVAQINLSYIWPIAQNATISPDSGKLLIRTDPKTSDERDKLIGPARYDQYQGDAMERTGIEGLAEIDDINFICMPDLMKAWSDKDEDKKYVQSVQALAIAHCDRLANRMVILDTPRDMNPQVVKKWRMDEARYDSSRAVLYYPWIEVMDPATNQTTFVPPSGFVAGIWARNDTNRGVHKAPANEVIQLAVGLKYEVGQGHQEILNPNGINCIRPLRGMGIRVWGARTLSQSDPEWKYVNVRRLFHMIEQSIQRSTMWAVFEPNDHRLWAKLRRDVRNFLMTIYSQGMLFGATPAQAFFVKCDEENNPKYTRDLGQVIVDIGVAPVKPAEFVIFRIRQWSPEDEQA